MSGHRLGDLVADAVHRMEAGERILEDHRDVLAADPTQRSLGQTDEIAALEMDLALEVSATAVEKPHHGKTRHALARPGFADDAQRLTTLQRVREVRHGLDVAVHGREDHRQVPNLEEGRAAEAAHAYRTLGSRNA